MPTTPTPKSEPETLVERAVFEEPRISAPLELARSAAGAPMMAMLGGSGGSPSLDTGGFPPDGFGGQIDGYANIDGGGGITDVVGGVDIL